MNHHGLLTVCCRQILYARESGVLGPMNECLISFWMSPTEQIMFVNLDVLTCGYTGGLTDPHSFRCRCALRTPVAHVMTTDSLTFPKCGRSPHRCQDRTDNRRPHSGDAHLAQLRHRTHGTVLSEESAWDPVLRYILERYVPRTYSTAWHSYLWLLATVHLTADRHELLLVCRNSPMHVSLLCEG